MEKRVTSQKALELIMSLHEESDVDDLESDNESSLSDNEYEHHDSSSSSDESSSESMSADEREDIPVVDSNNDLDIDMDADVSRHVDECIEDVIAMVREQFFGRDGTIWKETPLPDGRRQALNVMRSAGGLSALGRRKCKETALSYWQVFFDNEMLDLIVDCTNDKS